MQYVIAGNGPCGGNVDWTEGGGTPHCHVVQEISQMPDSTGVCGLNTESAICDLQVWGQESLVKIKLFVELLLEFSTVALNPTRMIPTHLKRNDEEKQENNPDYGDLGFFLKRNSQETGFLAPKTHRYLIETCGAIPVRHHLKVAVNSVSGRSFALAISPRIGDEQHLRGNWELWAQWKKNMNKLVYDVDWCTLMYRKYMKI